MQAVDAWKERHGLESLHLDEPSGMSEANVASPADLVRISQLALANPVVANIVAAEYAELPWGLGEVPNTNPLFGLMPGVVGLKTGFTEEAGYNLAAAAQTHIEGRDFTGIAVVFSRDSLDSSAEDAMTLLATLLASPHTVTLVESGERVGVLRTVDRQVSGLIADERASAVVAPGEVPSFTSELSVGGSSGSLIVETPGHTIHVPIHLERTPQPPSFWWRITHPLTLFGIGVGSPVA